MNCKYPDCDGGHGGTHCHRSCLFDYAPIMTTMEQLHRKIHDNYLRNKPELNAELIDQLLVETRLLRTYNIHVLEK